MWDTWTGKHKTQLYLCPHTADWTKQGFTRDKNIREEQAIYSKRHRAVIRRPLKTERQERIRYEKGIYKRSILSTKQIYTVWKKAVQLCHIWTQTKNHSIELNCEARQSNKFTGMNTAQGGPRGCFLLLFVLLLPFCIEVSDSIFPASTPARCSRSLHPHPVGPQQHRAHPWWKKDSSNLRISTLPFHKQIFGGDRAVHRFYTCVYTFYTLVFVSP